MEKGGEDTETLDRLVQRINPLWIAISCGYMVSWTSIGSLISYFKARQGAAFYVALYCAFYLPGLPVSLLQQRFDENIDRRFGSANAFMFRVCFSMVVKILMLFILPFIPSWVPIKSVPYVILCCMAFVGTFSWLCHGTACQLCSMFPPSSTAYLQTGFRTPEIYTLAIVSVLSIGSTASDIHIIIFYYATALVVAIGAISWVIVARSKPAMAYFAQKDQNCERKFSLQEGERASLLSNKSSASHPNYANAENREISSDGDLLSHISQRLLSSSLLQPRSEYSVYGDKFADMQLDEEGNEDGAVNKRTDDDIAYEDIDYVAAIILPCRVAIFLNIWSSIFSAAFFAYVRSSRNLDIELVLYFVRLFSDLIGRPLAHLPRPSFVRRKDQVVRIALMRMILMIVFFAYILFDWIPKSDLFIALLVCVFSVLSGYLAVLSYEYAAASVQTKAGQSLAGTLMNSTFQLAAFSAVVLGVIVSNSGVFEDPGLVAR